MSGKQRCQCSPGLCKGNLEIGVEVLKGVMAKVIALEDPNGVTRATIYQWRDELLAEKTTSPEDDGRTVIKYSNSISKVMVGDSGGGGEEGGKERRWQARQPEVK